MRKSETIKRPDFGAKGRIKIELFDEDGNLVEKNETTNFISKGMDTLYRMAMANLFTRGKGTDGKITDIIGDPFYYMRLTDATHDEGPDTEWLIRGAERSYATTTGPYAGGANRGSYNVTESFTREDQVRIVVDFPRHAANGRIGSVYFSGDNVIRDKDAVGLRRPFSIGGTGSLGSGGVLIVYDDIIYGFTMTGTTNGIMRVSRYDKEYNLISQDDVDLYDAVSNTLKIGRPQDVEIFNNNIYLVGDYWKVGNYPRRKMIRIPLNSLGDTSTWVDETSKLPPGSAIPSGILYNPDNQRFYLSLDDNTVSVYDSNFNILRTESIGMTAYRLKFLEGVIAFDSNSSGGVPYVLNDDFTTNHSGVDTSISGFVNKSIVDKNGYIYPKAPFFGFSSRAKLDSPVTKTAMHNMTVTYDFILPSIYDR